MARSTSCNAARRWFSAVRACAAELFKLNARQVDVAPTIARIAGLPKIAGRDASGSPAEVYLKRQDGKPLDEIIDDCRRRRRSACT